MKPTSAQEKSVVEHLEELRYRLLISLFGVAVACVVSFKVVPAALTYLLSPLPQGKIIFLGPMDALLVRLRLAGYGGLLIASPLLLFQMWRFIAPALTPSERKVGVPFLVFGPLLFFAGGAFSYLLLPFSLTFLLGLGGKSLEPMLSVDRYFSFLTNFALGFGVVFEMPLVSYLLSSIGLLTPAFLRQKRGIVVVGLGIIAAVLTPPDVFSQMVMLFPLLILYELSIGISWLVWKRRKRGERGE